MLKEVMVRVLEHGGWYHTGRMFYLSSGGTCPSSYTLKKCPVAAPRGFPDAYLVVCCFISFSYLCLLRSLSAEEEPNLLLDKTKSFFGKKLWPAAQVLNNFFSICFA